MNRQEFEYTHLSGSASDNQVFTGRGILRSVVVNTTANAAINISDALLTVSSGTSGNVGILKANVAEGTYRYDVSISQGLTIARAGASDITVCWAKG